MNESWLSITAIIAHPARRAEASHRAPLFIFPPTPRPGRSRRRCPRRRPSRAAVGVYERTDGDREVQQPVVEVADGARVDPAAHGPSASMISMAHLGGATDGSGGNVAPTTPSGARSPFTRPRTHETRCTASSARRSRNVGLDRPNSATRPTSLRARSTLRRSARSFARAQFLLERPVLVGRARGAASRRWVAPSVASVWRTSTRASVHDGELAEAQVVHVGEGFVMQRGSLNAGCETAALMRWLTTWKMSPARMCSRAVSTAAM